MSSLREYFDDLEKSSDKWEPYFNFYERHAATPFFFKENVTVVEVGVQNGGSLEMWSKFIKQWVDCDCSPLKTYKIIGIDIDPKCLNHKYEDSNVSVVIGDQNSSEFWDSFLKENPTIDLFIDDGGHYMNQQILTFEKVFPCISKGGVYICEDTHTSYMASNGGGLGQRQSFIEYAKGYVDVLHYNWKEEMTTQLEHKNKIGKDLSGIFFYDSMVVFEKFEKGEMKRVFPKRYL